MGRPFRPTEGLNRLVLDTLATSPGLWVGPLARLVDYDSGTVTDTLGRLEAYGLVTSSLDDGHRACWVTDQGYRTIGRRRPRRTATTPTRRPQPVR